MGNFQELCTPDLASKYYRARSEGECSADCSSSDTSLHNNNVLQMWIQISSRITPLSINSRILSFVSPMLCTSMSSLSILPHEAADWKQAAAQHVHTFCAPFSKRFSAD